MATASINGEVLRWARQKAGLSLEEACDAAKIRASRGVDAVERLSSWEGGNEYPTRGQAEKLAKAYRRPLITFYMRSPPSSDPAVEDFRTIADRETDTEEPLLASLLRLVRARQQEARDLLEEDDESEPLPFVGSAALADGVESVAESIRSTLRLNDDSFPPGSPDKLFRLLRDRAENIGVFVQLVGDLGSRHSKISADVFRGFVLPDPVAPFVVVNPNDAKAAYSFTLLHELAHLWLGEGGISNQSPFAADLSMGQVESFCNNVAAQVLLPKAIVVELWGTDTESSVESRIERIVKGSGVSYSAVAHRLWRLGLITESKWWELYELYKQQWERAEEKERGSDGFPPPAMMWARSLGGGLVRLVLGAVDSGDLTRNRASRILKVKPEHFEKLRKRAS